MKLWHIGLLGAVSLVGFVYGCVSLGATLIEDLELRGILPPRAEAPK